MNIEFFRSLGLRTKLILIFVAMKVIPLILLGWLAWIQVDQLIDKLVSQKNSMILTAHEAMKKSGETAVADATLALDKRAREDIERHTTDTALQIARFLYDRDNDIRFVSTLKPNEQIYRQFILSQKRDRIIHGPWKLSSSQQSWVPVTSPDIHHTKVDPGNADIAEHFSSHPSLSLNLKKEALYLEVTFIGLDGQEQIKATTSNLVTNQTRNVSDRRNTFVHAETYFSELQNLKPGEIYVSEVIGAYVGSKILGTYTPQSAKEAGIPYAPEKSAYAGTENPVGKRFKGLIRWATPVVRQNKIIGWVTLALNHDHLTSFTNHIMPVTEGHTDIPDATSGNYAYIWDYKGRNIAHPRHYSIVGYDPKTGDPVPPWLEESIYQEWQQSGQDYKTFSETAATFRNQKLALRPADELTKSGNLALDCRFLNFAPQCTGWHNLTEDGGSGSFAFEWLGMKRLVSVSTIPYYTGVYGKTKRGFGYVTIGINTKDFHKAATKSKEQMDNLIAKANQEIASLASHAEKTIKDGTASTTYTLVISALLMIIVVILIAIWMASYLSNHINWLIDGITRFRSGERHFRFKISNTQEINQLASSLNVMADTFENNILRLEAEIRQRRQTEAELREIKDNLETHIEERTRELSRMNVLLKDEVEERRTAEARAHHLANHDPLTGIANRLLFKEQLHHTIHETARSRQYVALLFLDLDRFKPINDSLGHAIGDAILIHVSKILQNRARKTDTVARLGGDEFAVIMTNLNDPHSAAIFAQKIIDQLQKPVKIEDQEISIGASIGITIFSGSHINKEQVLLQADMAMYQAKSNGGNRFCFFEESMQNAIIEQKRIESDLIIALESNQFQVHFQPQYNCLEKRIIGVEAFVRWMHPEKGLLYPAAFIETASRCGLMQHIDKEVLRIACMQAQQWIKDDVHFGRIAINLLPKELSEPNCVDNLITILHETGLPPEKLDLEITERSLLDDSSAAIQNLTTLKNMGITISIDDFGIEYSSLQRLVAYPVDNVKIDRFFVSRIGESKSEAVIAAIMAMARSMDLQIIAKGVETQTQLDYLRTHNCNIIQGNFKSPPMPVAEITAFLQETQALYTQSV